AADNPFVGPLVVSGLVTTRRLAPRRHRMAAAGSLTFTTTVRVIDRVHNDTAVMRTLSEPAGTARLTGILIFVINVAYLADRRHAIDRNAARLARGQLQQRVGSFARNQLGL